MGPDPTGGSAPAESSHAPYQLLTHKELGEPSHRTNASPLDGEDSVTYGIYDMSLERFYCEEYDCGRGFSSMAYLESHTRYFHANNVSGNITSHHCRANTDTRQPAQAVEGEKEIATS